ncbi:MAG: NAD(P)-binding domain-containing protein, partial [Nitrospinae bacterium]|nr:NAD(P)-binding domain-containing protein [Nitrospinota bacterium]
MAEAMIKGLISASFVESKNIFVSDVVSERLEFLHSEYKVKTVPDNRELVEKSDILILAVKPQVVKKVLENVRDLIDATKLLVSVAAAVP